MVKEIRGSMNATLPAIQIIKPTQADGYMIVAHDLLQGVEALSNLSSISPRSCALIAAYALECTLKAFLWYRGKKADIRKPKTQHDLLLLWDMAYKEKVLSITATPPDWVRVLASGHGPHLYFRYQEGEKHTVVHGGQTPALIPMATELGRLIQMVELVVKG